MPVATTETPTIAFQAFIVRFAENW